MPSISDAIHQVGVNKELFSQLYEKALGKPLSEKVPISEANLAKIQKMVDQLPKNIVEKITTGQHTGKTPNQKKEADTEKVLKSDELGGFGGGGFLSGLGFGKAEEKVEEKIDLDEYFGKAEPVTTSKVDLFDIASRNVNEKREQARKEGKPSRSQRSTDTHHPNTPNRKPNGNISIEQTTYVAKEKGVSSSDIFDAARARGNSSSPPPHSNKPGGQHSQGRGKPYNARNDKPQGKPVRISDTPKVHKDATTSANLVKKTELFMDERISVKEFSEKMGVPLPEILKKLMENKIMTGINSSLDFDTAMLIGTEFNVEVKKHEKQLDMESFMSGDLQKILDLDKEAPVLLERAPVVTVMGHVDHGKTSLLDYLRKTGVAEGEAGGITQSIGASVVEYKGEKITFIDTPGHELFTSLRARGAKLTNIAIIVIAADDSVMPQTIESINHAKAAGVPIIIAITKIDKPGKNLEQIKSDIAAQGLTPEEWGGETPII
ncbi:MAG: translation initiation factor IF-2 N-terminal domain-containing protein [Candidatus Peribacteria bacterium]|jgi:translation initiation factor IF-2|nr:translation initiation factor IF-2 N-terminal domain-containing protein [Candidatus Peribacteria bacterium]